MALVLGAMLSLTAPALAADGDLVSNFGSGGIVRSQFDPSASSPSTQLNDVAVQSDGKIVAVGAAAGEMFAARYNPDGSPDGSFGPGGHVLIQAADPAGAHPSSRAQSVALQPDGKLVLAGEATDAAGRSAVAAVRLNANGTPDGGFGTAAVFRHQYDASHGSTANAVVLDGGEIVLAGEIGENRTLVVKLDSTGHPDMSFGTGGVVDQVFSDPGAPTPFSAALAATLDSSGRILLAGYGANAAGDECIEVVRLTSGGTPDPSFSGDGVALADVSPGTTVPVLGSAIALQSDGGILVTGQAGDPSSSVETVVVRFLADGSLDAGFGTGGTFAHVYGSSSDGRSVAVQPNGRVLAAGLSDGRVLTLRLDSSGHPDPTFGTGGSVLAQRGLASPSTPAGSSGDFIAALPDGTALVAGYASGGSAPFESELFLTKITADQPPVAAFTPAPAHGSRRYSFSAALSSDADDAITSYHWTFGDGSTGTGVAVSHTYGRAGSYAVTLTATDSYGLSTSLTRTLQVTEPPGCTVRSHTRAVFYKSGARAARARHHRPALHRFSVKLSCTQTAALRITGTIRFARTKHARARTFRLHAVTGQATAGRPLTLKIKLPAKAVGLLRAHRKETTRLRIAPSNGNGSTTAQVTIRNLRARRLGG